MKEYKALITKILGQGFTYKDPNRPQHERVTLINQTISLDVDWDAFPILTGKKIYFKAVVEELLWFLRGGDDVKDLVDDGVNIWNKDVYNFYRYNSDSPISYEEWLDILKSDDDVGIGWAGKIYGQQLRAFGDLEDDQLQRCIIELNNNHFSSSNLVSYWNINDIISKELALNPCHYSWQLLGKPNNEVDMVMNMRSCDVFLGLPFNISSYAILLLILCRITGKAPGTLHINMANAHIYSPHLEAAKLYLTKPTHNLPKIRISGLNSDWETPMEAVRLIENLSYSDINLIDYQHEDYIKAEILPYEL